MTPRNLLLVIVVIIGSSKDAAGAAFSNVVVQRTGVAPVEYFTYDPSLSFVNSQVAQYTAPLESIVQAPSVSAIVTPCLAPCIIPNTGSQALAPVSSTSNAKIIAYNAPLPNVPVVMSNKEAARGYQYAYAVYDDNTGDKKSQSEQSDGSVVQGQYSFIQPDGFRREVIYTADDLKGFNAVVRTISPEVEQRKESKVEEVKPQPVPCPEPQNAQLTETNDESTAKAVPEVEQLEEPKSEPKYGDKKSDEISVEKVEVKEDKNPDEKAKTANPVVESSLAVEPIESASPLLTNIISYNDIIKCLQAKLINANSAVSPITYILIPSLKGLC